MELCITRIAWLDLITGKLVIAKRNGEVIGTVDSLAYAGYVQGSECTHLGRYMRCVVS